MRWSRKPESNPLNTDASYRRPTPSRESQVRDKHDRDASLGTHVPAQELRNCTVRRTVSKPQLLMCWRVPAHVPIELYSA